jgi:hypothetical protein
VEKVLQELRDEATSLRTAAIDAPALTSRGVDTWPRVVAFIDRVRALDSYLSQGGTPPEAWTEGPDVHPEHIYVPAELALPQVVTPLASVGVGTVLSPENPGCTGRVLRKTVATYPRMGRRIVLETDTGDVKDYPPEASVIAVPALAGPPTQADVEAQAARERARGVAVHVPGVNLLPPAGAL